ncbi:hypothetical protein J2T57_002609 [Natronocella acetinitrilica]|uniref:Uncharacterized protein n=1 Tax=Natronocella acetinitrilica TaxID=414046 RepID=A0AAE3G4G3_9GAMM|nr:hypothetical protein [Natronocella acetinitrilica]MCP1675459.1 hypothetical protein [Natronocella acetinitrilica]
MSALIHEGREAPQDPVRWDPDNREWVSISWAESVARHGAIQASEWRLPDGWTAHDTRTDVTVYDVDQTEYAHANQVEVSAESAEEALAARLVLFTNRVTFADGTQLDRSARFWVAEQ